MTNYENRTRWKKSKSEIPRIFVCVCVCLSKHTQILCQKQPLQYSVIQERRRKQTVSLLLYLCPRTQSKTQTCVRTPGWMSERLLTKTEMITAYGKLPQPHLIFHLLSFPSSLPLLPPCYPLFQIIMYQRFNNFNDSFRCLESSFVFNLFSIQGSLLGLCSSCLSLLCASSFLLLFNLTLFSPFPPITTKGNTSQTQLCTSSNSAPSFLSEITSFTAFTASLPPPTPPPTHTHTHPV